MATVSAESASPRPSLPVAKQFTLSFYWLTWNIQWTAIIFILMPLQVLGMVGEEHKALALGVVTSLGAVISLVFPPLVGALSDRTRTALGRRRPYMLWGSALDGAALLLLAFIPLWLPMPWSIVFYVLAVMLLQFGSSVATSPYAALIPDVVPASQLGLASGWLALMTLLGNFLGNLLGGFGLEPLGGMAGVYGVLLGLFALGAAVTILGVREPAPPAVTPFSWRAFWQGILEPLKNHNFRWVFLTRMFVVGGQWTVQAFLLYYFKDVFFDSSTGPVSFLALSAFDAEQGVALFLMMVLLGALPSSWMGGLLSDRFGRKPMVYVASGLMSFVVFLFTLNVIPAFEGVLWLGLVFGLGYGAYTSVDWALACDVLPSQHDYAKDMGVWHIASMVPQVVFLPLAGLLLDVFQRVGQSMGFGQLGYTVVFALACVLFVMGTVFVVKIKGVR